MSDEAQLLAILEAHGQRLLQSFPDPVIGLKRKRIDTVARNQEEEEEWHGIKHSDESDVSENENLEDESRLDHDDDLLVDSASAKVVVFSESRSSSYTQQTKQQMKSFMSSRVSKIRQDLPFDDKPKIEDTDEDSEISHTKNDALLHKLIHTKLLAGSLDPHSDLTPAERRKALAGRIRELSGKAKLGRGEKLVRKDEHNKASKRVREGLIAKRNQREASKLEEAKNLGNYHPTLKKLFGDEDDKRPLKKRERGLGMGIGKFKGGMLKLSKDEITHVQGTSSQSKRKKR